MVINITDVTILRPWQVVELPHGRSRRPLLGLVSLQLGLKLLLKGIDVKLMSAFGSESFWLYSIIRTIVFQQCMSKLRGANLGKFKEVAPSETSESTNLTQHGHDAFIMILRHGRKAEPIILEILHAGLRLKNVRDLKGIELDIWSFAAFKGHMEVLKAMQAMGVDVDTKSGVALRAACYALNAGLVKHLLDSGASAKSRADRTPLILAVASSIRTCYIKKNFCQLWLYSSPRVSISTRKIHLEKPRLQFYQ